MRYSDNVSPPGVGYRLVEVKDASGNLVITHENTIEKADEIDPEAAEWTRRGAEIAVERYLARAACCHARPGSEVVPPGRVCPRCGG